jgi:Mn-dependent DtxR family transcriptional regulator
MLEYSNIFATMKLTRKEEDYLETIYRLSAGKGSVGISDIARSRGVSLPTVISAVNRLKGNGMVQQAHYGKVSLTAAGEKAGADVYETHTVLRIFFGDILGLSYELSEDNACRMEHDASREVIVGLKKLIDSVKSCDRSHAARGSATTREKRDCPIFKQGR